MGAGLKPRYTPAMTSLSTCCSATAAIVPSQPQAKTLQATMKSIQALTRPLTRAGEVAPETGWDRCFLQALPTKTSRILSVRGSVAIARMVCVPVMEAMSLVSPPIFDAST